MKVFKTPRELAEWNDEMVRRYDIERYYERSHPITRWLEQQRLSVLRRMAQPKEGERMLEVGCGAGHVLEKFDVCSRTGVDLSAIMLARTARRLGNSIPLVQGSADALPFPAAAFDIVVCTEVLEHTTDPACVIEELLRVAGPGGRVIVSVPNEAMIDRAKATLRRVPVLRSMLRSLAAEGNEWHLQTFDLPLLLELAKGRARVTQVRPIPNRIAPIRFVAEMRA
ncbi:MAG: methyltransferase domain-containing protein [Longimicrobiales bacterium]